MGGASAAGAGAGASAAGASSAASQQAAQQASQLAQRQALASGVTDAFGKIGDGFANQKTGYSPNMFQAPNINSPVFPAYNSKFGVMTDEDLRGGRLYSGTNFSNSAQRSF